jgi:hypothetical protein
MIEAQVFRQHAKVEKLPVDGPASGDAIAEGSGTSLSRRIAMSLKNQLFHSSVNASAIALERVTRGVFDGWAFLLVGSADVRALRFFASRSIGRRYRRRCSRTD